LSACSDEASPASTTTARSTSSVAAANQAVPLVGEIDEAVAALETKLEKRMSRGVQFQIAYTWAHALANSGTPLSGSGGLGTPDPTNFASEYSTASWDIRHNFTTGFVYELPFGRGKALGGNMSKALDAIAANWHLNGLLSLRTGQPYTLRFNVCQGVWGACRPDAVPGRNPNDAPAGGRTPDQWFDVSSVAIPASLTGGNLGLQSQTAPPNRTLDFSAFKDFPITERWKLQFRAESFNLANTPQFNRPDNNLQNSKLLGGNGTFGKITTTAAGSERHLQFELRLQF